MSRTTTAITVLFALAMGALTYIVTNSPPAAGMATVLASVGFVAGSVTGGRRRG